MTLLRPRTWRHPLVPVAVLVLAVYAGAADDNERRDPYRALKLPRPRAEALRALQSRVDRENRQLRDRLEDRRDDLEDLYRQYDYNHSRCTRLRREIRDLQSQLLELHHRFQVELRVILTREEFDRLQKELREARRRRDRD
jgi:septal ring factor EnvC (AmiA/AmiB activator)